MIWLRDQNELTCNAIIGNASIIEELKEELRNKQNSNLFWTKTCVDNIRRCEDFEMIKHFVNEQSRNKDDKISSVVDLSSNFVNTKAQSLILLDAASRPAELQSTSNVDLMRMFFYDVLQLDMVRKWHKDLDSKTFQLVMEKLWGDFYCFATEVLKVTDFEIISQHNVGELEFLNEHNDKHYIPSATRELISQLPIAEGNAAILKLAKNINKK